MELYTAEVTGIRLELLLTAQRPELPKHGLWYVQRMIVRMGLLQAVPKERMEQHRRIRRCIMPIRLKLMQTPATIRKRCFNFRFYFRYLKFRKNKTSILKTSFSNNEFVFISRNSIYDFEIVYKIPSSVMRILNNLITFFYKIKQIYANLFYCSLIKFIKLRVFE